MAVLRLSKLICRVRSLPPMNSAAIVLGKVGGLVGGLGAEAQNVFPRRHFQCLGLEAAHSVEHYQALLRSAVQGTSQGQLVVDPDG